MRKQKGITLIALVITIIVLLILAAVSITALTDEDKGVVTKAKQAASKTEDAADEEDADIQEILDYADSEDWGDTGTSDTEEPEEDTSTASTVSIVSHEFSPTSFSSRANIVWNNTINVEKSNPTETLTYRYKFYGSSGETETYNEACDYVITSADTTISGTQTIDEWDYGYSGFVLVKLEVTNAAGELLLTHTFNDFHYTALTPNFYYTFGVACLPAGTMVTVEVEEVDEKGRKRKRRKKKKIEDLTYDDELVVWDFDKGCFTTAKPLWLMQKSETIEYNLLKFSDGTELKTIVQHRIFNKEAGKFTYPMTDETPIGTTTFNENGEEVTLVSKEVITGKVEFYNVISHYHMNVFAEGILTSCRFNNLYPIKDMKFVKDDRELVSREEYQDIPDEYFDGLRLAEQPKEINRGNDDVHAKSLVEHIKNVYIANAKKK